MWSGEFSVQDITTPAPISKEFRLINVPFYYVGQLDKIIKEYLVNHVLDILSHGEMFIDPSNGDARIRDLISLNNVNSESEKNAAVYFLLVFLELLFKFSFFFFSFLLLDNTSSK